MAIKKPKVDVVVVGLGWTGALIAQELTEEGLQVLALERGPMQDTPTDANYPKVIDELAYSVRGKLYQDLSGETVTVRHAIGEEAQPFRQHGAWLLGNGVGGAGFHWNGMHYRNLPEELEMRSHHEQKYGKKTIPEGMTLQDHGVTYEELEPFFTQFEEVCGTSGTAGNIQGRPVEGGNPFEGWRSKAYPTPALKYTYGGSLVEKAAREVGWHPAPLPADNCSEPYTNRYGVRMGPCNYCGFCENYGCYMYSKASPQTTILPVLMKKPNFELRAKSHVLKVLLDGSGRKATGVLYVDAQGNEVEQPAEMVMLTAYQMHNVRLLLLSGIGKPYDPVKNEGVVGKNLAYQVIGSVNVQLPKNTYLNRFVGGGAVGVSMDDYNADQFDHSGLGFIGGAVVRAVTYGGRPIKQTPHVPGTPNWGKGWKAAAQDAYNRVLGIGLSGSVMPYRDTYLDLDPTYKDKYGMPLLRWTFDWHDNEHDMIDYVAKKTEAIGHAMGAEKVWSSYRKKGAHFDVRPYQSTHTTGGAIMGTNPKNSVVNKYLQCWDVPNVFVHGASAFPWNMGYNPTGLVGALTLHSAHAMRTIYLKNPGPMVQA
ncbi:MAG: GMC family oxidoreductase [Acidovorax sp.]